MACWCGHGPWCHWGPRYGPPPGYGPGDWSGSEYGPPPWAGQGRRRRARRSRTEDLEEYLDDLEAEVARIREELQETRVPRVHGEE